MKYKVICIYSTKLFYGFQVLLLCLFLIHFSTWPSKSIFKEEISRPEIIIRNENLNSSEVWIFKNFDESTWNTSQKVLLKDDTKSYFRKLDNGIIECFIEGTNWKKSKDTCQCLEGYYGKDCGIPECAWFGHFKAHSVDRKRLKRRIVPRRIINGILVNHEFDLFETRVKTLETVVDVFMIQESNYTSYGSHKGLEFLDKFRKGWLAESQHKFTYVFLNHFPEKGRENGWYTESYIRTYLSLRGLPMIDGKRDDDLFLLADADELQTRESLLFLKLYDGYSEPVRFGLRWTVYGFFWLRATRQDSLMNSILNKNVRKEDLLMLYALCTLGMLKTVYNNNALHIRNNAYKKKMLKQKYINYTRNHRVAEWNMGTLKHYAGFHCSWCFRPEGIRTKLLSAQKHDKPRWGDYPEKTNLTYIGGLIQTGSWFDGTQYRIKADPNDRFYAPKYILDHKDKFEYLLELKKPIVIKKS